MKRVLILKWFLVLFCALGFAMVCLGCGSGGGGGDDDTDDDNGDDDNLPPGCTDEDKDGYSPDGGDCGPIDCDDNDPNVHPKADEICDGKDDNCDGKMESECWQIFSVDNEGKSGRYSSIWFDQDDNPAVAYIDSDAKAMKLAHFDGSDWNVEVVDSEYSPAYPSLKIGPDGTYYIAYTRKEGVPFTIELVYLAYGSPKGWTKERVKGLLINLSKEFPSLTLTPSGEPVVFFFDSAMIGEHGLVAAKKSGGAWAYYQVDAESSAGYYDTGARTYAATSADGRVGVAYQDEDYEVDPDGNYIYYYTLKYAETADFTTWTVEDVHSFGEPSAVTGGWSAMAYLPSTNQPVISFLYGSGAPTDPAMALKDSGVWNTYSLELDFGVGEWPALAAVGSHALFAYLNINDVDLDLCDFDMTTLTGSCDAIDSEGDVGKWSNIALNSTGDPAISYYDLAATGLKVAWYRRFSK